MVADEPLQTLQVFPASALNSGVLSAIDQGTLLLQNTSIDQTGGGIIEANGGTVTLTGSTVVAGTLLNSGAPNSVVGLETNTLVNVDRRRGASERGTHCQRSGRLAHEQRVVSG